jgi:hypothetical protein
VLLGSILVNWSIWEGSISTVNPLRLPNEVLEDIVFVLCEKEIFGLLNDVTEFGDQGTTFTGKLLGWTREGLRLQEAVERNVDLFIL